VGIFCTNPIQTFLDLFTSGEREEEAAEHLLNRLIKIRWNAQQKEQVG